MCVYTHIYIYILCVYIYIYVCVSIYWVNPKERPFCNGITPLPPVSSTPFSSGYHFITSRAYPLHFLSRAQIKPPPRIIYPIVFGLRLPNLARLPYVGNPGFGIHCHTLDSVNLGFIWRAPLVNPLYFFGFTYMDS